MSNAHYRIHPCSEQVPAVNQTANLINMCILKHTPLLGNINEVCLVSSDIYSTIKGLQPLGIGPFSVYTFNAETVLNRQLRGQPADFELLVAFAKQNDLVVEIMQPLNNTRSIMAEYLEANGSRQGVQHIAFNMDDAPMDKRIAIMKERGYEPVMEGVWKGKKGQCRFVYFDTLEKGAGVCIETIEFSEDWEEPEGQVVH